MEHRVTQNLVLRASAAGTPEWSRGVPIGQDNTAMYEVTIRSGGVSPITVDLKLMGSNNLENWSLITTSVVTTVPSHTKVEGIGTLSWDFLRMGYLATHGTLTPNVMIAATITTSRKAG